MQQSLPDRRSWLCIAYAFPPINRSGTHRTLAFVKHLHRAGWDATVLTVDPRDEPIDDSLLAELPDTTSIIRTKWFRPLEPLARLRRFSPSRSGLAARDFRTQSPPNRKSKIENLQSFRDWLSRLLQLPDSRIGWLPPAVWAGLGAIRRRRPDVIYSTSPYASAHLIALVLSRLTRLPWVADFRDPWCANPFRNLPYSSLRHLDALLERVVVASAAHIVCNTPTVADDFQRRYPTVASRCTVIANGIDFERFTGVQPKRCARADEFVLLHSGQFYGPRSPAPLFAALRRLATNPESDCTPIRLALLGPDSYDGQPLRELAAQAGVADRVDILGTKCHAEALSYMAGADALILVGGAGHGADLQVPNKLFEYLALRRPILALLAPDSPARTVLREARADAIVCEPTDDARIAQAMQTLADPNRIVPEDYWTGLDRFDRSRRAVELLAVFERISKIRAPIGTPEISPGSSVLGSLAP